MSFDDDSIILGGKSECLVCYWKLVEATPFNHACNTCSNILFRQWGYLYIIYVKQFNELFQFTLTKCTFDDIQEIKIDFWYLKSVVLQDFLFLIELRHPEPDGVGQAHFPF